MACNIKGIGFHIGSIRTKQFSYKYGYVNMGSGLNWPIEGTNLERETIENIESHDQLQYYLDIGRHGNPCKVSLEQYREMVVPGIWLCSFSINSHKGVGLFVKETDCAIASNWRDKKNIHQLHISMKNDFLSKKQTDQFVIGIGQQGATLSLLTGGKGSSLAELHHLSKSNDIESQFTVPRGLVVTTTAYQLMLQHNTHLQELITSLELFIRKNKNPVNIKNKSDCLIAEFEKCTMPNIVSTELENQFVDLFGNCEFNGKMFAVRSSAVGEDGTEMSAAGQMSTFLGVTTLSAIKQSVIKCWASQFSHTAIEYKRGYGQPLNGPMAVVVQEMVQCDTAGVIFTCDPVSGNERRLVITANYGLGESVVGSLSDPDTIQVQVQIEPDKRRCFKEIEKLTIGDKSKCISVDSVSNQVQEENIELQKRHQCCLDEQQIVTLSNLALSIARHSGDTNRDIEWGFKDGHVFIFQSRPITSLDKLTEWEIMHEMDTGQNSQREYFSRANLGEVFPGASSYICLSWLLVFWKAFGHKHWKHIGTVDQVYTPHYNPGFGVAYNTVFFILKTVAFAFGADTKSAFTQGLQIGMFGHEFEDEELRVDSMEKMPVRNQSFFEKVISAIRFASMMFTAGANNQKVQQQFGQLKLDVDFEQASSVELFHVLGHQVDRIFPVYANHLTVTVASMMYNALLYNFIRSNSNDPNVNKCLDQFSQIVSSAQNIVSARVPKLINSIARAIDNKQQFLEWSDESALHYLMTSQDSEAASQFRTFLLEFGHRGYKEFDPYALQWDDNPMTLVHSLKAMISKESEHLDNKCQEKEMVDERDSQLSFVKQKLLDHVFTPLSQHGVRIREQGKDLLVKSLHQYRKIFWKLADKLVEEGKIPEQNLLFFMSFIELAQVVSKSSNVTIVANAKARQRHHHKKERLVFHETTFGPEILPRNLEPANTTNNDTSSQLLGVCRLKGVPVSSGKVIARCCVATSLKDAKHIQKGDVLVTFSTDIGWSPYFVALSGLVTEIGGLISHGAVIAREYGLPCLVGVENAMQTFQSGDIVLLDTENGEIIKLDHIESKELELIAAI